MRAFRLVSSVTVAASMLLGAAPAHARWGQVYRPDAIVRAGGDEAGRDHYSAHGAGQVLSRRVTVGERQVFRLTFIAKSTLSERLRVSGCAGHDGFGVVYRRTSGRDVTAAVTGAGLVSRRLIVGDRVRLRLAVRVTAHHATDVFTCEIASANPTRVDAVVAAVRAVS